MYFATFILNIFGCHKYLKKHNLDALNDVKCHVYGVINLCNDKIVFTKYEYHGL
jgi:hypothetical protein